MSFAQDDERAATILGRRADGSLAFEEALAELADANCIAALAALIAERVHLRPDMVARALDADADEAITIMCRAAGLSINGYSALLRMRRRRHHGTKGATDALTFFSGLPRATAERMLKQMATGKASDRVR